jgi:hypothetical protein
MPLPPALRGIGSDAPYWRCCGKPGQARRAAAAGRECLAPRLRCTRTAHCRPWPACLHQEGTTNPAFPRSSFAGKPRRQLRRSCPSQLVLPVEDARGATDPTKYGEP